MAISLDSSQDGGLSGGASHSFSYTVGGGSDRILLASVFDSTSGGAADVTSVTFNGVAMTMIASRQTDRWLSLWRLVAPATGAHTLLATGSTTDAVAVSAVSYFGVDQTTPINAFSTNNSGVQASIQSMVTSTVADCWFVIGAKASSTPAAGTGVTQRVNGSDMLIGDSNGPQAAGDYFMTITSGGSFFGTVMAALTPAGASRRWILGSH